MKLPPFVKKNQKALSWVAGLVVAYVLFVFVIAPYRTALLGAQGKLASEQTSLKKERDAVATAKLNPKLQEETDSAVKALEPKLFESPDDAIATSDLQSYIHQVGYDNHVNVMSSSTRPASVLVPGVRNLHIDLRAESDYQGILAFLRALSAGDKLVSIERMDIQKSARGSGALAAPDETETISFNATISGYAMGDLSTAVKAKPGTAAPAAAAAGAAKPATPSAAGGKQ